MLEFYIWAKTLEDHLFFNNSRTKLGAVGEQKHLEMLYVSWTPLLSTVPTHLFTSPFSPPFVSKAPEFWALLGCTWELLFRSSQARPSQAIHLSLIQTLKKRKKKSPALTFILKGLESLEGTVQGHSELISNKGTTGTHGLWVILILRGYFPERKSVSLKTSSK